MLHDPVSAAFSHAATNDASLAADPLQEVGEAAVARVARWLTTAAEIETSTERKAVDQLGGVVTNAEGVAFAMRFVDRVMRPEDHRTAAGQLVGLVGDGKLPGFLSPIDKALLRAGARLAPLLPGIVMPLAARRMRGLVGHLVVDSEPAAMQAHLHQRSSDGFRLNVNLLGEAVLGDSEAGRRFAEAMALLDQPDVDYVSVKVSAIVSQLNYWDWPGSIDRVLDRLRPLMAKAATTSPRTFINLDMEEYHDLELTMEVFMRLLDEPELHHVDAGIVLQAYLPESFNALKTLSSWAADRHGRTVDGKAGGITKIRLVKGANLAMERVEAAIHGWEQAPYRTKSETDANYKRCLDWVLDLSNMAGIRIGVASHNLFDVAFARELAERRDVADRVEFEMLEGMASSQARAVRADAGGLLLYTPVVAEQNFDVAISYLFRRLEENAADENFIHSLLAGGPGSSGRLQAGSAIFEKEAQKFRSALADRWTIGAEAQRNQRRADGTTARGVRTMGSTGGFVNEPDTDPALPENRRWAEAVVAAEPQAVIAPIIDDAAAVDAALATGQAAQRTWAARPATERRAVLHAVADQLVERRGDLISAMVHEANKTFEQADPEVSEAVDFARYYGHQVERLQEMPGVSFEPFGTIAVVPPWNFPVAITTGGVMAAIAAGNSVILKPAPETPRCAEIIVECCRSAGVPDDLVQLLRVPENEVGKKLISSADAVILTGAAETAKLFRSWKPSMRLFAETSGKNAMIITENADLDLAVADLVASAFGHSGQKCSAASLAICVGKVYRSPRFRRQLIDAVTSLQPGPSTDLATTVGPTIAEPSGALQRALTELEPGESWLVEPRQAETDRVRPTVWTPGVRLGVTPGTWFHRTECFGPVLGIMFAADLDEALAMQNSSDFGLTGGLHSLDDDEIAQWLDEVEVGNAYINKPTTGAIVQRQPFGGWKGSSVGPGAKAGGPNYIAQLGTWVQDEKLSDAVSADDAARWLAAARLSDAAAWRSEFSVDHDPTGLFCEENTFRYRPMPAVIVRVQADAHPVHLDRVRTAAERCGVPVILSRSDDQTVDDLARLLSRHPEIERVRVVGSVDAELSAVAANADVHLIDGPVTGEGRLELAHYLKEQAVSRTLHRYGNLL